MDFIKQLIAIIPGTKKVWLFLLIKFSKKIDGFSEPVVKSYTQNYISPKYQEETPSDKEEPIASKNRKPLIPYLLKALKKSNSQKYFLVLAGTGMGKTALLVNLYLKYKRRFFNDYKIKLLHFGELDIDKKIIETGNENKTILLLDAFDEDKQAINNYTERIDVIINKIRNANIPKVVIACRIQFFTSQQKEPDGVADIPLEGSEQHKFQKLYISPFDDNDTKKYINKKFRGKKRSIAMQIAKQNEKLMARPLLLSYIEDLIKEKEGTKTKIKYYRKSQVYKKVVNKWIKREAILVMKKYQEKGNTIMVKIGEIFEKELFAFSRVLTIEMYRKQNLFIKSKEIKSLAEDLGFNILPELNLKNRTLLNRYKDGERYKFTHKSILEYFLALKAIEDEEFYDNFNSKGFDEVDDFYKEMLIDTLGDDENLVGEYSIEGNKWKSLKTMDFNDLQNIKHLILEEFVYLDFRLLRLLTNLENFWLRSIGKGDNGLWLEDINIQGKRLKELIEKGKLNLKERNLRNHHLTILNKLKGLVNLNIGNETLDDLAKILANKGLTQKEIDKYLKAKELSKTKNKIDDISELYGLKELHTLWLANLKIEDISVLKNFQKLRRLDLLSNKVKDITPLESLSNLEMLGIAKNNEITDIKPIIKLNNLNELDLSYGSIKDENNSNYLIKLTTLEYLSIREAGIESFSMLKDLKKLKALTLWNIKDFSKIKGLNELTQLKYLIIKNCNIEDIDVLKEMKDLLAMDLRNSQIELEQIEELKQSLPDCKIIY